MQNRLIVCGSPHIHERESVRRIMWMVVLSLIPAGAAAVLTFGLSALWVVIWAVAAALITEAGLQKISKRKITILDGSAFLTGLLLAYNLPPNVPFWLPIAGSFFAVFIGKFVFGGLGKNIFNPALAGRAFLMASWPKHMTSFTAPIPQGAGLNCDAVTAATQLAALKEGSILEKISYLDLFFGRRAGCIGEVCIAALLAGAIFLIIRGYISWHIPVVYILTTGILGYIFGPAGLFSGDFVLQILSGGLALGAFFMATDYVTSPLPRKGQVIFALGCGVITAIIRKWGGYPEGVCYAILMMNAAVPLIDRYSRPRVYGRGLK